MSEEKCDADIKLNSLNEAFKEFEEKSIGETTRLTSIIESLNKKL